MLQLGAALEVAGAQPQEGDAVAVVGVHVGLDLEHEAADLVFGRLHLAALRRLRARRRRHVGDALQQLADGSEEHTSELQSLMRISYAVFCLKKKKNKHT